LAARRFLATRTLDQILRDRNEITDAIREDVRASAQSYGVEILRADVKDLVFPGNLREIMNRVIETERESEASVIAASKAAQVARIKAEAEAVAAKDRLEADRAAAQLLVDNPQLVRLRELEVLREIGLAGGNQFFIGLDNLIGSTSIRAGVRSPDDAT
jgi:regulator of protease activity HflC (stomatin/prohibitin superfamily)